MAKKSINSDIYNLVGIVNDTFKAFLPDEEDETLAIGLYGAIQDTEAKRLQTQVRMTGELCNESFPSRARLERNVITHAILAGIEDINAVPAKMTAYLAIRETDVKTYFDDSDNFYIDRESPIYFGDYEFHLEYDIIISKIDITRTKSSYTARYDMTRENPSSDITNPYLSAPAVIYMDGESYIYLTVILSQVIHNTEYKKLVTSNIIDNKTINFEFENQLAYFEVHCTEPEDEFYLTPTFEGASVEDGVNYYCWYQYLDTNIIRVRFDRNSYMPSLNAEIEVLYKTTNGEEGNFSYTESVFTDLSSDTYGYRGLNVLVTPVTDSLNGKDRKSKKELQSLIPKESLSRGSLTTITDLNNYFGMLDSDYGRIVVQKKIDNQQERVYYTYLLLKDSDMNVIPSNTIDVNIPMDQMVISELNDSDSARFILKSGACIKLDSDGVGQIYTGAVCDLGLNYTMTAYQTRGKYVSIEFKVKIEDDTYTTMEVNATIDGMKTVALTMPTTTSNVIVENNDTPVYIEDYVLVGPGQLCYHDMSYTSTTDASTISISSDIGTYFDIEGISVISGDTETALEYTTDGTVVSASIDNETTGTVYKIRLKLRPNVNANSVNSIDSAITITEGENTSTQSYTVYIPTFTVDTVPDELIDGGVYTYTLKYLSSSASDLPSIDIALSRGLEYVPFSTSIVYEDGISYTIEPTESDISDDAGFLYTNPYTIVVNQYHLYSAFYMMSMNDNPYLHFDYINQKSQIQFISTSIGWIRPFLGYDKDQYTMTVSLAQSVQEDLGLIVEDGQPAMVKCIAVFYRDGEVYRYKTLDLASVDSSTYTFYFTGTFYAKDMLDNDNNIRIEGMEVPGQLESDETTPSQYGYFNPNTEVKIYALCAISDTDGAYTRRDLDAICPGLDLDSDGQSWTVTNIYEVVNGVDTYHNYSEIMGSRATPYGTDNGDGSITTTGFLVKGVPVYGYDYCQDETLVQNAIDTLNYRKAYLDETLTLLENSFNLDFKFFNTYGPSNTYYVIKDSNSNYALDDDKEFIDRVNLTLNFRVKLVSSNDSYTRSNIISDIKEYIEDLDDLTDLHIPNLVTQITNTYSESITYFEYLGFNSYGADVQHIYQNPSESTDIHICPEFLNVNNVKDSDNALTPDINVYVSET